jgi:hypothetical protein
MCLDQFDVFDWNILATMQSSLRLDVVQHHCVVGVVVEYPTLQEFPILIQQDILTNQESLTFMSNSGARLPG